MAKQGYHLKKIPKGKIGESSKILEEILELQDAEQQNSEVMALVELSDLVGAINAYLKTHFDGHFTMGHLQKMAQITERVFRNGIR